MWSILAVVLPVALGLHGLIHLMGFVAYWPLKQIPELPYKTAILNGQWNLGVDGMRLYSVLWLATAAGFLAAAVGLTRGYDWARPALVVVTLLSLVVTALDWEPAFRGTMLDVLILFALLVGPQLVRAVRLRRE
jgi:hypothetical protein